jgi:osmoprotectant transport system substrate-binding protein
MTVRKAIAVTSARAGALLVLAASLSLVACAPPRSSHIVIGAKNFTEQVVLGELLAQEIEASGGGKVERRFWLAGSYLCQQALISDRMDGYVEYTGTALTAILKQPLPKPGTCDEACVHAEVARLYEQRYNVRVGPGLGFQDTFAMVVRADDARRLGLKTISDVARVQPPMRLGVGYEFEERPDGLRGLSAAYDLHFAGEPRTMELGLLYRALSAHEVDIVAGNSTDGAIQAMGFVALEDDKHYFPPYEAVPLVREDSLRRWPQIGVAMERLAGKVSEDDMRAMNVAVDGQHRDVSVVVREFRAARGL